MNILNKNRQKSVTKFFLLIVIIGILFDSAILFSIIFNRLGSKLNKIYTEELKQSSTVAIKEINYTTETLQSALNWIQNQYESKFEFLIKNETYLDELCKQSSKLFELDDICIFDRAGNQISSDKYGKIDKEDIIHSTLKNRKTSKIIKSDSYIYSVVSTPVFFNDNISGAIIITKKAADDSLVQTMIDYTRNDFTIFDEEQRVFTSIKDAVGTELNDKSILDKTKQGKDVIQIGKINDNLYLQYYFPLIDNEGNFLTTLFIGKNINV